MKFIIFTRFGLYVDSDAWYEKQLLVLTRYLLPSLSAQSDKDFLWLLAVDEFCPSYVLEKLSEEISSSGLDFRIVVFKRKESGRQPKIGGTEWLFEEALDKVGRKSIFSSPDEFYVSAMIDSDDGWHFSTVKYVKQLFEKSLPSLVESEDASAYLTSPSAGAVLTFTNGLYFFEKQASLLSIRTEFSSMSIFVLSRVRSGISCNSSRHLHWEYFHKVVGFKKLSVKTEKPMWIYTKSKAAKKYRTSNLIDIEGFSNLKDYGWSSEELKKEFPVMDFNVIDAKGLQRDFFISRYEYLMNQG